MQRPERHLELFVIPNIEEYLDAEAALTRAHAAGNGNEIEPITRRVLRLGLNAAVSAYHLADAVAFELAPELPGDRLDPATPAASVAATDAAKRRAKHARDDLHRLCDEIETNRCISRETGDPIRDLTLLCSLVDAYKHAELTNRTRLVPSVLSVSVTITGAGELANGEGKPGGGYQCVIRVNEQPPVSRALASVLLNVTDMWHRDFATRCAAS